MTKREETLEMRIDRLEGIVAQLESGSLGLEDSVAMYEDGILLAQSIQKELAALEARIDKLSPEGKEQPLMGGMDNDQSAE